MGAHVGDRLMPDGDASRAGVVIGLRNADGSPPFVVKWLSDGHIALVFPGPYARLVRGDQRDDAGEVAGVRQLPPTMNGIGVTAAS